MSEADHTVSTPFGPRRVSSSVGLLHREISNLGLGEHTYSDEEKVAFSNHINQSLGNEKLLSDLLPLNCDNDDLFVKVKNGLVLALLINSGAPGTIDLRVLNTQSTMSIYQRNENLNRVIAGAKDMGCVVVNIGAKDLAEANHTIILGLLWQIIRSKLMSNISLHEVPELALLLESGESEKQMTSLAPESLLIRWLNYHLMRARSPLKVSNLGLDLCDGEVYLTLLNRLEPKFAVDLSGDFIERAKRVIHEGRELGAQVFIRPEDICHGNKKLNAAFVAQLFNARHGLEEEDTIESILKLLQTDESGLQIKGTEKIVEMASGQGVGVGAGEGRGEMVRLLLPVLLELAASSKDDEVKAAVGKAILALTSGSGGEEEEKEAKLAAYEASLPALLKLLGDSHASSSEKDFALQALLALARSSPQRQALLVQAGLIPLLVDFLEASSTSPSNKAEEGQQQQQAETALELFVVLSGNKSLRPALIAAALTTLFHYEEKGATARQRELALRAIEQLTLEENNEDSGLAQALATDESLAMLIKMLTSASSSQQEKKDALKMLRLLSKTSANQLLLVQQAGLLAGLLAVLTSAESDESIKEMSLQILVNLSKAPGNRAVFLAEVLPVLSRLLAAAASTQDEAKSSAYILALFGNLSSNGSSADETAFSLALVNNGYLDIPTLIRMLSSSPAEQSFALKILRILARHDASTHAIMVSCGILPPLGRLLLGKEVASTPAQREAACEITMTLSMTLDEYRQLIVAQADLPLGLIAFLRDQNYPASQSSRESMKKSSFLGKKYALIAIKQLSVCYELTAKMRQVPGMLSFLVWLLKHGDNEDKEVAAYILWLLAFEPSNKVPIKEAGAVPPLVVLLRDGQGKQTEFACAALWKLAMAKENKLFIRQHAAITPLVSLLSSGNDKEKEFACLALWSLAIEPSNKVAIKEAGAIAPLVALLSSGCDAVKENAAGAVWALAIEKENKVAIKEAGAIALLVILLNAGNEKIKENAAAALWSISVSVANKKDVFAAGAIPGLVKLLESGTEKQKEYSAGAVMDTAVDVSTKVAIQEAGAIPPLVALLEQGNEMAKALAAGALGNLSAAHQNRLIIQQAGAISKLVAMLKGQNNSDDQKDEAKRALYNLAAEQSCRDAMKGLKVEKAEIGWTTAW